MMWLKFVGSANKSQLRCLQVTIQIGLW